MNDEIRVPVSLPLDSDGFLRRECPTCEREYKWFSHQEGDPNAEIVDRLSSSTMRSLGLTGMFMRASVCVRGREWLPPGER